MPDNSTLGRHYALDQKHLPHIITSIESKLGNPTTDNAILHLIVYVPPCSGAPLHIYDAQRKRSSLFGVDSFLSPKWGGIVVANPDESVCAEALSTHSKVDVRVHSGKTMQVMLYLLRKLVDVQNEVCTSTTHLYRQIRNFVKTHTKRLPSHAQALCHWNRCCHEALSWTRFCDAESFFWSTRPH